MQSTIIITRTGLAFDLINPRPEMICIEDIAWHLSSLCRYNGASRYFFSVAQHSLLCVELMKKHHSEADLLLATLLHDAAEAYVGDIVSPLKKLLPQFVQVENAIEDVIFSHFGLNISASEKARIKQIDTQAKEIEMELLIYDRADCSSILAKLLMFSDISVTRVHFLLVFEELIGRMSSKKADISCQKTGQNVSF